MPTATIADNRQPADAPSCGAGHGRVRGRRAAAPWPPRPPPASRSGRCSRTTSFLVRSGAGRARADAQRDPRRSAPTRCGSRSSGARSRPAPARKTAARLRRHEPGRLSGLPALRRPRATGDREGLPDHDHARARCPQLGDGGRPWRQLQGRLERLRRLRARRGQRYSGIVRRPARRQVLLDLERAQPHLLPQAPLAGAARLPPAGRARRAGAARRGRPGSQIFVGELAPVGTATKVLGPQRFMQEWLCLDKRLQAPARPRPRARPAARASRR